ncbi:MAG: leucine-rich repeat domain-containing protein, partial [Metamycoplasmataceae bacterium]
APNVIEISPRATSGSGTTAAFSQNTNLLNIEIPNKVQIINYASFLNATNLVNVTFQPGSELTSIGNQAFAHSPGTIPTTNELKINLPESIISIGASAFSYSMLKEITIPSNITLLQNNLFEGSKLQKINFSSDSTLIEIGYEVFKNVKFLDSIIIPNSVTKIGNSTFEGTELLKSIAIPDNVTSLSNNLFENSKIEVVSFNTNSKLLEIGDGSFKNAKLLNSIIIPNSVTKIGNFAFQGTDSLKVISIPDNVINLSNNSFESSKIETINFGKNSKLELIGQEVFKNATSLNKIVVPYSVTSIGDNAFLDTPSLTSITLPSHFRDNVSHLGLTDEQLKNIFYEDESKANNTGLIVGSIVGVVAVIAIGLGGFVFWKKRKNKSSTK